MHPPRPLKCPDCFARVPSPSRGGEARCPHCRRAFRPVLAVPGFRWTQDGRRFSVLSARNPDVRPLKHVFVFENFLHPEVLRLRRRFRLDRLVAPFAREGEFARQRALRHWVSSAWTSGLPSVRAPARVHTLHAGEMFRHASTRGCQYFCTYKAYAMVEFAAALGWNARLVSAGGHMMSELWSNERGKWVFFDSLFNLHVEKEGLPLSCLEIQREYRKNGGRDVEYRWGRRRTLLPADGHEFVHLLPAQFAWFVVWTNANFFDEPNEKGQAFSRLLFRDRHNRRLRWTDASGEGDRYATLPSTRETSDPADIDFPLNVAEILLAAAPGGVRLGLETRTPGLKRLLVRVDGGPWRVFDAGGTIPLKQGRTAIRARSENQAGVRGPESEVVIEER
ncbi:MAG: hypothetical protein AAB215_00650 [Planctomycetota bacterium]